MYNTTEVEANFTQSVLSFEEQIYHEQKSLVMHHLKRHTSVLECIPNHYGPDCRACACNGGLCLGGKFGSGTCLCDQGWYWSDDHHQCLELAFGVGCEYDLDTGTLVRCDSCYEGRTGPTCHDCTEPFVDLAVLIAHTV